MFTVSLWEAVGRSVPGCNAALCIKCIVVFLRRWSCEFAEACCMAVHVWSSRDVNTVVSKYSSYCIGGACRWTVDRSAGDCLSVLSEA